MLVGAGQYSAAGATIAINCASGYFSSSSGATACTAVLAGTYSNTGLLTGSTGFTQCQQGYYSSANLAPICDPVPAGSYSNTGASTGSTGFIPCAAGTYASTPASTSCTNSPAGAFSSNGAATGSTSFTLCNPGYYAPNLASTVCTISPIGTYISQQGAITYTACPSGWWTSSLGTTVCSLGAAGGFISPMVSASIGSISWTPCSMGAYDAIQGFVSGTGCPLAPAGSFVASSGATSAPLCSVGTYSATSGATACIVIPAGSFSNSGGTLGSTGFTACLPNYYSGVVGSSACQQCPPGTNTRTLSGATACTPITSYPTFTPSAQPVAAVNALSSVSSNAGLLYGLTFGVIALVGCVCFIGIFYYRKRLGVDITQKSAYEQWMSHYEKKTTLTDRKLDRNNNNKATGGQSIDSMYDKAVEAHVDEAVTKSPTTFVGSNPMLGGGGGAAHDQFSNPMFAAKNPMHGSAKKTDTRTAVQNEHHAALPHMMVNPLGVKAQRGGGGSAKKGGNQDQNVGDDAL